MEQAEAARAWMEQLDSVYDQNTTMGKCPTTVESAIREFGVDAVRAVQRELRSEFRPSSETPIYHDRRRTNDRRSVVPEVSRANRA